MAKKSMIAREKKRSKLYNRFKNTVAKLKSIARNINECDNVDEFFDAQVKLQKISRNASPVRRQRRCNLCGRPHSVIRRFGLCRICLRIAVMRGDVPGVRKASW